LAKVGTKPQSAAQPPDTVLGDWYANVLVTRPQHLVLCISERTLLPVVLPAKDAKSLPVRLAREVSSVLAALGVPPQAIKREQAAMLEVRIGPTANKSVLGSLNELMFQLRNQLHWHPDLTLLEHSLRLAGTPMQATEGHFPDRAAVALFAAESTIQLAKVAGAP
jgi:hypothetical protein